jgi:hypothetical protein
MLLKYLLFAAALAFAKPSGTTLITHTPSDEMNAYFNARVAAAHNFTTFRGQMKFLDSEFKRGAVVVILDRTFPAGPVLKRVIKYILNQLELVNQIPVGQATSEELSGAEALYSWWLGQLESVYLLKRLYGSELEEHAGAA